MRGWGSTIRFVLPTLYNYSSIFYRINWLCNHAHVISPPRPSHFSACNIEKNWEWPGDEATRSTYCMFELNSSLRSPNKEISTCTIQSGRITLFITLLASISEQLLNAYTTGVTKWNVKGQTMLSRIQHVVCLYSVWKAINVLRVG